MLDFEAKRRYARHLVLAPLGEAGQVRLREASVLIAGVGGLGASAAASLAAMGVGRLTLLDPDRVELSNLPRQLLYETADQGRLKVEAACDRLEEMNPGVHITCRAEALTEANAAQQVRGHDLVLDGLDTAAARFILNDACLRAKIPWVHAAISGFAAQMTSFLPSGPCYRCLVPALPAREITCAQEGVLGSLALQTGAWQAGEGVKILLNIGENAGGALLVQDTLAGRFRRVVLNRDPECPACASL